LLIDETHTCARLTSDAAASFAITAHALLEAAEPQVA
jgi:hypothetical protein